MIKFRRKEYSNIGSGARKGALLGASIGTIIGGGAPSSISGIFPGHETYNSMAATNKDNKTVTSVGQRLSILGVSTAVGALLGALVGIGQDLNNHLSRRYVDDRLMTEVISRLKSKAYQEGKDFTRDPKEANVLRTKVCIVFSKNAGEFKILVNVVDDYKLNKVSEDILKSIPRNSQVRKESAVNRYNEINISTIPDAKSNVMTTVNIVSKFIESGYPVYMIEVG